MKIASLLLLGCLAFTIFWFSLGNENSKSEIHSVSKRNEGLSLSEDQSQTKVTREASSSASPFEVDLSSLWQEIKSLLPDIQTRAVAISMALEARGFPDFFLGVIPKEMESNPELANPMAHLLASILGTWPEIPGENIASEGAFILDLLIASESSESVANVAARAWKNRRLLDLGELGMLLDFRPHVIDGASGTEYEWRALLFLYALEDVLRANMEADQVEVVDKFLSDPSERVRVIAIRLLFDGKPASEWAVILDTIDSLSFPEICDLAEWIASSQGVEDATSLLQSLFQRLDSSGGFLGAWTRIGARDRGALEGILTSEFDVFSSEQGELPPGSYLPISDVGQLEWFYKEGAMRKEVMDAYFLNSHIQGKAMDAELLLWMARLDENPLTRSQAWRTLGRDSDDASLAMAIELFRTPGYMATLRDPGAEDDGKIAEYLIQYIAPRLGTEERNLLLQNSSSLLLAEEDRAKLEAAFD